MAAVQSTRQLPESTNDIPQAVGERFRVAVANKSLSRGYQREWFAVYACKCGQRFIARCSYLRGGHTQSCGCARVQMQKNHRLSKKRKCKHGSAGSAEYQTWTGMIARCENPKNAAYRYYGGKGVKICKRWRIDFTAFLSDMGSRPAGTSIDRINSAGDYCPENCRWADITTQNRNRSGVAYLELNGIRKPLIEWAQLQGIPVSTLRNRIKRGVNAAEAVFGHEPRKEST